MHSDSSIYDVVIIGGGPAGLSAAIYAAREGMTTVVLDSADFGGMAALTESIENYPGFSNGVGGQELVNEMRAQAERFGAVCEPFQEVTAINTDSALCTVETETSSIRTRTVLITTGSTYRTLGVSGEEDLIGRGIHFCATCDAPLYKGKDVIVIGGGNSALQESLFIARFADRVRLLVRGNKFTGTEVLINEVVTHPNITVEYNVEVDQLKRITKAGQIMVSARTNEGPKNYRTNGIFVFVGLIPNSHPFTDCGLDEKGFIISDQHFRTKLPRVFVAGDVRSGSTWQIGSATGEGISAALVIRGFLDENHPQWHQKGRSK